MFRCLTPWTHRFSWPQFDPETKQVLEHCTDCGAVRRPPVELDPNPRFAIPRYEAVCTQTK